MKKVLFVGFLIFALAGCAAIKQGISDYKTGKDTPLVNGETSPSDEAKAISQPISVLPVVGGFAPTIAVVLTGIFTFLRGRRIRQANGLAVPASSNQVGIDSIIQAISNIAAGAFEVGPDNSPWKRAWKVFLSTVISGSALALTVPAVQGFVLSHPAISLGISGLSALFAALEKQLSTVAPASVPSSAPTTSA